jgi:hypothetical protein
MASLIIDLTEEQHFYLGGFLREIEEMSQAGKPGMLVAQVYGRSMVVGVIPHEKAIKVQEAMRGSSGKTTSSPDDRSDIAEATEEK